MNVPRSFAMTLSLAVKSLGYQIIDGDETLNRTLEMDCYITRQGSVVLAGIHHHVAMAYDCDTARPDIIRHENNTWRKYRSTNTTNFPVSASSHEMMHLNNRNIVSSAFH